MRATREELIRFESFFFNVTNIPNEVLMDRKMTKIGKNSNQFSAGFSN